MTWWAWLVVGICVVGALFILWACCRAASDYDDWRGTE